MNNKYYTYIIRCVDNSLYTGITTDVNRRFMEHVTKSNKGAKYTHNHIPKEIVAYWESDNRVIASKLEYRIKKLSKLEKESLIINNNFKVFNNTIDDVFYKKIK